MKKTKVSLKKSILELAKLWLPPLVWASVIFAVSAHPVPASSKFYWKDFVIKKTAHIIEYAVLATALYRGIKGMGVEKKNAGVYAIIIAAIYGITDEVHQVFTPGREARVRDVFFDTIGATLAIYTIWNYLPKAPQKLRDLAKNLQVI